MSLANMSKALKCANNDDTCMIKYEEGDSDSITFTFADTKRDKTQDVTVKMMDIDSEHLGIPEQDYAVVCEMPASEFQKTCKDLTMFTDTLNVTATKAGIVFSGKGDNGQSVITYSPNSSADSEDDAVTLEVTDPVNVNFSIKYMNQFTKASSLSSRVRISLSNDVPIVVEYRPSQCEAQLASAALLKKIIEAIKASNSGAHQIASKVKRNVQVGLFDTYRCDRTINLGMSLANMSKALKCANNDDTCMIKYEEGDSDSITFTFADTKQDTNTKIEGMNEIVFSRYPLTDDGKSTGQQNGHLRFYLAPKIDEEENMD
ncbi:proliferating cell nuclear antigen [Ostertagia ostertagi]